MNLRGGEEVRRRRKEVPPPSSLELLSAVHSVAINREVANDLSSTTRERVNCMLCKVCKVWYLKVVASKTATE